MKVAKHIAEKFDITEGLDSNGKSMWTIEHKATGRSYGVKTTDDGFAHYTVYWPKGPVPKVLSGRYTSFTSTMVDAHAHFEGLKEKAV